MSGWVNLQRNTLTLTTVVTTSRLTETDSLIRPLLTSKLVWQGFIYMAHAIIDKAAAWREVSTLTVFDDGNSKTNTLYWVATRP